MQGSLEDPPIVVRYWPWKARLLIVGAIVVGSVVAAGAFAANPLLSLLVVAVCVLFIRGCVLDLRTPVRLELSPSGLHWYEGQKEVRTFAWSRFEKFEPVHNRSADYVRYWLVGSGQDKMPRAYDGVLPDDLEVGAIALAGLLYSAKVRWGTDSVPRAQATDTGAQ